jgi:hypothetical protein
MCNKKSEILINEKKKSKNTVYNYQNEAEESRE